MADSSGSLESVLQLYTRRINHRNDENAKIHIAIFIQLQFLQNQNIIICCHIVSWCLCRFLTIHYIQVYLHCIAPQCTKRDYMYTNHQSWWITKPIQAHYSMFSYLAIGSLVFHDQCRIGTVNLSFTILHYLYYYSHTKLAV